MLERSMRAMGVVGGCLALAACGGAGASEESTGACGAALSSAQGVGLQGMTAQGIGFQGKTDQGLTAQGLTAQGLTVQGITAQGFSPQGVSPQGFSPQGVSVQGIQAQGLQAQGMQSQGIQAQGIQAQGLQAQGIQPQGLSAQGIEAGAGPISAASLAGLGLRGVSEAEAASWVHGEGSIQPENIVFIGYGKGVLGAFSVDGRPLEQAEIEGVLLPFATAEDVLVWLTITDVTAHPDAPDLPLYALALGGENICGDGISGMFVPGIWDETGTRHDSIASSGSRVDTTYSCTTGVIAKCVAWGYRPWTQGAGIHEACTRMARADYCGDGVPHTENGTLIDLYDTRSIQTEVAADGMSFEAGWNRYGAVCVRQPRYVDHAPNGDIVYPSCWSELPKCDDFATATSLGAELGNNSHHLSRELTCAP